MSYISKNERRVLTIWLIVGIIVCALIVLINIKFDGASLFQKITKQVDTKYSLIKDRDRYYSVKSSVDTFYAYINDKSSDSLMKILDAKYVDNNKLTNNNVLDKFKYDKKVVIKANNYMCEKKIAPGKYSYYTQFILEDRSTGEFVDNVYFDVVYNHKTTTFTIKPIDSKTFGGACHGK